MDIVVSFVFEMPVSVFHFIGVEFLNRSLFVGFLNNLMLALFIWLSVCFSGVSELCGNWSAVLYTSLSADGGDDEGVVYF